MKSNINKKKPFVFITIFLFLLFNILAISNVYGVTIQKNAVFNLDKEDPLGPEGYGVFIPSPNTIGTVYIDGSNQGKFTVTDWLGDGVPIAEEIVNVPGDDISLYYPTDLDNYEIGSFLNTHDIDHWNDVSWLNISAYNAEADILSPYTVSTVFDYYAMEEGTVFTRPFNYEHPMQIDLIIKSTGPKVLKFDWLTDNPDAVSYAHDLISPSSVHVNYYEQDAVFMGITSFYNYLIFTANQIGTYRLVVAAFYTNPASLCLEFLDIGISSLSLNAAKLLGNFDDFAALDVSKTANWQSNWLKFTGNKGDVFRLDIYEDFATGFTPTIDIWTPCSNGYLLDSAVSLGSHDIYFPRSGAAYVSFTDVDFEDWYRYSVLLTKADNVIYTLGDLSSFSISMDSLKTIQFSLSKDSIVRFNYTSLPNPPGVPVMDALGTSNAFIFRDSKEIMCYDINSAFLTRTIDSTLLRWHYMPAGTYKAIIRNSNPLANGIFQISSKVYPLSGETIPVNTLKYPKTFPTEVATVEFQSDDEFSSLKSPIVLEIEIPDLGLFRLNTTMWANDNEGASATSTPSYLYTYNSTGPADYYSLGYPQPVFSLDGDSTINDYLYIGAPTRWTGMTFDFSVLGAGGSMELEIYDGGWPVLSWDNDGTSLLTTDGTIEFDISDLDFDDWIRGSGGIDIDPTIDETDYYWMRLDCTGDYSGGTVPIIQDLTLLNNTIRGSLQYMLIGESGYKYDDYWGPSGIYQPIDPSNLEVTLDGDDGGIYTYDSRDSSMIATTVIDPGIVGVEGGTYKLIIVPEQWDYAGNVKIQLAVEDLWGYVPYETYDIKSLTPTPNLHVRDITNYTLLGYSNLTGEVYDYGLITEFDAAESYFSYSAESYFALECYGDPYKWTQLVVTVEGLGGFDYDLYILQDLPWIGTYGPNSEVMSIRQTITTNTSLEFGVFSDQFTLVFELAVSTGNITFYISLSQYDTIEITTSDLRASYIPPLDPALILALAIGIPAAVGVVVMVYLLKRKGKILTKHPT
ncbi:MAG: hypothetical protein ACFFEY_11405 [Candidatus Thorarchaeota archaeon]